MTLNSLDAVSRPDSLLISSWMTLSASLLKCSLIASYFSRNLLGVESQLKNYYVFQIILEESSILALLWNLSCSREPQDMAAMRWLFGLESVFVQVCVRTHDVPAVLWRLQLGIIILPLIANWQMCLQVLLAMLI